MGFVARENMPDMMNSIMKKKRSGNAKHWEGYDKEDMKQADMEMGLPEKKKKK